MRYDVILADLDNTLLDFRASSYDGLRQTFSKFGLPFGETERDVFFAINDAYWVAFEKGEIDKSEIYEGRFRDYFDAQGMTADVPAMNAYYMIQLQTGHHLVPHSKELLEALRDRGCRVYAVTNGEASTQHSRLDLAGISHLFDGVFISETMEASKPSPVFFRQVFSEIGLDDLSRAIILGDSLTSDMQGGRNAGVATCFFGDPAKADDRCDYVITDLMDFLNVIR